MEVLVIWGQRPAGGWGFRGTGCFCPMSLAWHSQLGTGFPKSCRKEPDVGLVAQLGDREHSWSSQPQDLRQRCLQISSPSRTLPRSHFDCCCSPPGSMVCTKHTQSCACARKRLQAQPGLMATVPTSLSLLLQEQNLTAEGRQDERALEVQKCIRQLEQSCESRGRTEGDASDQAGRMLPR